MLEHMVKQVKHILGRRQHIAGKALQLLKDWGEAFRCKNLVHHFIGRGILVQSHNAEVKL